MASEDTAGLRRPLEGLVKLAINLRLVALLLTVLWLALTDPARLELVTLLLAATAVTSMVPMLGWQRLGPLVLAHPIAMVPDLLLSMVILGALGLQSPFALFVVATALIAGALYGWLGAGVMSAALLLSTLGGGLLGGQSPSFDQLLTTPALVPAAAGAGAGIRRLLIRHHDTARALAESALTSAAATERTRLAREMHDTLAKTLHGVSLSATALPELLRSDPDRAEEVARQVASAAERAADEARGLIVDLRQDDLERPLGDALRETADAWGERTGVAVDVDAERCEGLSPSVRYELFSIAQEALRNAHVHGQARRVRISLRDGDPVVLVVADEGDGFVVPGDPTALADDGHFGVVGMIERAESVGGSARVSSAPGRGTTLEARMPRAAPGSAQGQLRPPPSLLEEPP